MSEQEDPLLTAFKNQTREEIRTELLKNARTAIRQHKCSSCGLDEIERDSVDSYNHIAERMYKALLGKRLSDQEWHELMREAAKIRDQHNEEEWD